MTTAVVILNWNGEALLKEFLPSLIANTPNARLIVADNGSTDGSLALLQKEFPAVEIVELKENHGFAKGYNLALQSIEADVFVLLNSDVEVSKGWLEPLERTLEEHPEVGAVQGKIRKYGNPSYFEYAGAAGGMLDCNCLPYCRGRIRSKVEQDHGQYDAPERIFWASGACMAIRKDAWNKVGGFDESFFAHQEEIDLCWRLQLAGYKIMYTPESVVYHVGGATLNAASPYKLYLNFRNNRKMMRKCLTPTFGEKKAQRLLAKRWLIDHLAALFYLVTFRYKYFKSVVRAYEDSNGPLERPLVENPDVLALSKTSVLL